MSDRSAMMIGSVAVLLLLTLPLCACRAERDPKTAAQPSTAPAKAPDPVAAAPTGDAAQILGAWVAVESQMDGKPVKDDGYAVFTDRQLKLPGPIFTDPRSGPSGVLFEYKLDSTATPKQIDLRFARGAGVAPDPQPLKAIYRFEDQRLRLCMSTAAELPRPTEFATSPADGRRMTLLERAPAESQPSPEMQEAGFKRAHAKLAEELRQRVLLARQLLRARQYAEFVAEFLTPEEKKLAAPRGKTLEQATQEYLPQAAPPLIAMLAILEQRTPWVNPAETEAFYDVRDVHVNDAAPKATMPLSKVDGKWYFRNR